MMDTIKCRDVWTQNGVESFHEIARDCLTVRRYTENNVFSIFWP